MSTSYSGEQNAENTHPSQGPGSESNSRTWIPRTRATRGSGPFVTFSNRLFIILAACDQCRRARVRCIQIQADERCRSCQTASIECTFLAPSRRRGPPRGFLHQTADMRSQNIETSQTSQPASQNGASQPSISAARSHYVDPSQFPNQQAQNQVSFNSSFSPVNPLYNLPMQPQNSFDPERQNAWQEDTAQGAMHFSAQYQPQTGMNPQPDPYSAAFQQAQFTRSGHNFPHDNYQPQVGPDSRYVDLPSRNQRNEAQLERHPQAGPSHAGSYLVYSMGPPAAPSFSYTREGQGAMDFEEDEYEYGNEEWVEDQPHSTS